MGYRVFLVRVFRIIGLILICNVCQSSADTQSDVVFSLKEKYAQIRAGAIILAGQPSDIEKRVQIMKDIFLDSNGNHCFPLIAAHGALWANDFFKTFDQFISFVLDPSAKAAQMVSVKSISEFEAASLAYKQRMLETNRLVFIDSYTNYYFTKFYGKEAGAEEIINNELLQVLNNIHQASRQNRRMSDEELRRTYTSALIWEQENSVGPAVTQATLDFVASVERAHLSKQLAEFTLKPIVRFSYMPKGKYFIFKDISNKQERIKFATAAFDYAQQVGFRKVLIAFQRKTKNLRLSR